MRIAADFCRKQEALQLARADSEPLENRRRIALTAAKAWAAEALLAEKRDSKKEGLDRLDTEIALEFSKEQLSGEGDSMP